MDETSNGAPIETINALFDHKVKYHATYKAIENIAELINKNSKTKIPNTKYLLKQAADHRFERIYYVFCKFCGELVPLNEKCPDCDQKTKKLKDNYFIYIPIEQQINYYLEKYLSEILSYMDSMKEDRTFITDIYSASVFKSISSSDCFDDDRILSLTVCTDGAQIYNSKHNFYPIFVKLNFLPPKIRFKPENILIVGLYYGKEKPDFHKIFFPFADELQKLRNKKILVLYNNLLIKFIPIVMFCTCDMVARSMMMCLKGHSGYFSCPLCLHSGKNVMGKKKSYVRYIKENNSSEMRNHKNFLVSAKLAKNTKRVIDGINGVTCMLYFENFDVVNSFNTDYMHGAFLGVMKHILDIWLGKKKTKNGITYISTKDREILDNRIISLKPLSNITRRPQTILDRSFYKASEYKNLLLFYLPFALQGVIQNKYIENLLKFSAGIYFLSKNQINSEDIETSNKLLNDFASEFENLYEQDAVTLNLHILRHYSHVVKHGGPLWTQSMFCFEKCIGYSEKSVNAPVDGIEQIASNYCLKQNNIMKKDKDKQCEETKMKGAKRIMLPYNQAQILIQNEILPIKNKFLISNTVKINEHMYNSLRNENPNCMDYFIETKNGKIGCIEFYIGFDNSIYFLLNIYEIIQVKYHLNVVRSTNMLEVHKLSEIKEQKLYLKYAMKEIITVQPNFYEEL